MDVDLGLALSTGLGSLAIITSGFAIFQNYSHKKLSLIMDSRIKDLEEHRSDLKSEIYDQKKLLNETIIKIDSLEEEISSLKKTIKEFILKSESLAKHLAHLDERLINHEEQLLNMAREAAKETAGNISNRIIRAELFPAIQTIKYVENSIAQIKREIKESSARAEMELEY